MAVHGANGNSIVSCLASANGVAQKWEGRQIGVIAQIFQVIIPVFSPIAKIFGPISWIFWSMIWIFYETARVF